VAPYMENYNGPMEVTDADFSGPLVTARTMPIRPGVWSLLASHDVIRHETGLLHDLYREGPAR
jgi:hypothetical protein